jgi:DnaJ-class molecular chaperone
MSNIKYMEKEDLYKILDIEESASIETIKKKYRKLSMMYHPDKNAGDYNKSEKFKKITMAYEILGDDDKKRQYDASRIQNKISHITNPNEIFRYMNEQFNFQSQCIVPPINIILKIEIQKAFIGCNEPVQIHRWIIQNDEKYLESETVYVSIPRGVDNGEIIVIKNKGNFGQNMTGDVRVQIQITNNTDFNRNGLDLIVKKEITLKEALCGFKMEILYLNGKTLRLNNNGGNVIGPYSEKVISGMGFQRDNHKGNLIIKFNIKMPTKLSDEKIDKLREIL